MGPQSQMSSSRQKKMKQKYNPYSTASKQRRKETRRMESVLAAEQVRPIANEMRESRVDLGFKQCRKCVKNDPAYKNPNDRTCPHSQK
jgi:hypothetical protein